MLFVVLLLQFASAEVRVGRAQTLPPAEDENWQISATNADMVDGQWELAQWCREKGLYEQRKRHLERILQLDPNHTQARIALGYIRVGDQWLARDEARTARAAQSDVDRAKEKAEREWFVELKRLRKMLASQHAAEAGQQIVAIRDPKAVRALSENLRTETSRNVQMLYIQALGAIGNREALGALINTTLNTPDAAVFQACIDQVVAAQHPDTLAAYIRGLQDTNNTRINRSAQALQEIGDQRAVEPLINALVTTHQAIVTHRGSTPGVKGFEIMSRSVVRGTFGVFNIEHRIAWSGSEGFQFQGQQVIPVQVKNEDVLDALVKLTGVNTIGFDQKAWQNWYALQSKQTPNGTTVGNE